MPENIQIENLKSEMQGVRNQMGMLTGNVQMVEKRIGEIYDALMGNKITQQAGIAGRMNALEEQHADMQDQIDEIKECNVKTALYVKLLWAAAGFILATLFSLILSNIFNNTLKH